MVRPLRESQKAAEGRDGGEQQTAAPSELVRRRITRKTKPAENELRQKASLPQHSSEEGKSWLWLSLHIDDLSVCGTHHNAAVLVSRVVHTVRVFSSMVSGLQRTFFAQDKAQVVASYAWVALAVCGQLSE